MYVINPKNSLCEKYHSPDGDYILAYARLHTNPSDWIKNGAVKDCPVFLARLGGVEPSTLRIGI